MKSLLEQRKRIKRKKPDFYMQDSHKKGRLKSKWRRPKGIDSKMRLCLKGYRKSVEPGFGSPNPVKGLLSSGQMPVLVNNLKDLESIDKEKQAALLSSGIGTRKRIEMLKKAMESGITIANFKDPAAKIKKIEEDRKKKLEEKKSKEKKKAEKKAKEKKEKKKKEDLAEKVLTEEEKAKKEKDKILTKKEM